ncbi:hypothetical protein AB0B28_09810 [Glycomyces sp. NPDC046736]|uniref:hypothetical protein n=1 Tax=Glycomyces sp. NPDC046736 TaxID=3155615 RepID=UPI0033C1AA0C
MQHSQSQHSRQSHPSRQQPWRGRPVNGSSYCSAQHHWHVQHTTARPHMPAQNPLRRPPKSPSLVTGLLPTCRSGLRYVAHVVPNVFDTAWRA